MKNDHLLNWILVGAIAVVACAIGVVGWLCIESVQKHAGKLDNYHSTTDNTKIDTHRYDVVKSEIDSKVLTDELTPSQEIQNVLLKMEGSEILFHNGVAAIDKKEYLQGVSDYSQVLKLIPQEAKKKSNWFAFGSVAQQPLYKMWTYRQRALCFYELGKYAQALADLAEAMKLRADSPDCYKIRANIYDKLGKKVLARDDRKTANILMANDPKNLLP